MFADRTKLPQLFFTGARLAMQQDELRRFAAEAGRSTLPGRSLFDGTAPESWSSALRLLATALPDGPAIVVLDEFPWLRESSPSLEGELQVAWDRLLEREPVLVILIGSDISMMEALTSYERPLFGRLKEIIVNPFELGDTAQMIETEDPALAIDAQLVTGGYPRICMEWRGATGIGQFFRRQFADENCELIDVGRNVLAAEFPPYLQATRVLSAIGAGARTNKEIGVRSGMQATPLARSLDTLITSKRTVAVDLPLSTRQRRDPRTGWRIPTCGSGCGLLSRHFPISLGAGQTWPLNVPRLTGVTTADWRWNHWCVRAWSGWRRRTRSSRTYPSSAVIGPAPTIGKSTLSESTGGQERVAYPRSVRSSGVRNSLSTAMTSRSWRGRPHRYPALRNPGSSRSAAPHV